MPCTIDSQIYDHDKGMGNISNPYALKNWAKKKGKTGLYKKLDKKIKRKEGKK